MADLAIVIRAREDYKRAMQEVQRQMRMTGDIAEKESSRISKMMNSGGMDAIAKAGKAAFLGLAAGAAIGGAALLSFTSDASDLNESISKSNVVFGQSADAIKSWAQDSATALGLSRQQAIESSATFGNLFVTMKLGQKDAANMSMDIVKLGADLASFNNLETADVLEKLRSGLVGEAEPLRALGVAINEAMVNAKGMEMGLADANGELTEAEKVQARYALILEQTKTAQGDYARTADGAANSQRTLSAVWENTKASLGLIFLPLVTQASQVLGQFLTEHEAEIQQFAQNMANGIERIGQALGELQPLLSALDATDILIIAAAIGGALVAAMVVWIGSMVAATIAAMTLGAALTLGLAVAIPLVIAALFILVRHWDEIWPRLKAAPMAILEWLKTHWIDALLVLMGPVGWGVLLIKNWNAIWSIMPSPVQAAMDAVAGIVETVINAILHKLGELVGKLSGVVNFAIGLADAIPGLDLGFDAAELEKLLKQGIDITPTRLQGTDGRSVGRFADGQFTKGASDALSGLQLTLDGPGGGGGGGVTGAAKSAANGLAELMRMYQQWAAATGGTLPQFIARIEMMQRESQLNQEIADAQFRVAIEQEKAKDTAGGLRIALKELALEALKSGRTLTEVVRDAFKGMVDEISSAFGGLFGRPTREQAQLNLEMALLEEERARARATGASEEELDAIETQIDALRRQADVYSAHEGVLKAQLDAADQSLITAEQQDFAAKLHIAAMNTVSGQYAAAAEQANLEALARANLIDAMNQSADAQRMAAGMSQAEASHAGSQAVWDNLNGQQQQDLARWLEMMHSRGMLAGGGSNLAPGRYIVGERGWEIMDVPGGSRVYSHEDSVGMARNGGSRPVVQHIHIQQLVTEHSVPEELRAIGLSA